MIYMFIFVENKQNKYMNKKNKFVDREIFFNKNLKQLRKMMGLSDEDLAEILELKIHSIRSYERESFSVPPPKMISRMCQYFNVTFDELFYSRDIRKDSHNRLNNIESSSMTILKRENEELERRLEDRDDKITILKKLVDAYENK